MRTPASQHRPSPRPYLEEVGDPEYPDHFEVRRGRTTGGVWFLNHELPLGSVLVREAVGIEPIEDGLWHLWFGPVLLGRVRALGRKKVHFQRETPGK